MGVYEYGCMSVYVYGCVGIWVYECISVWVYVNECIHAYQIKLRGARGGLTQVSVCMLVWVCESTIHNTLTKPALLLTQRMLPTTYLPNDHLPNDLSVHMLLHTHTYTSTHIYTHAHTVENAVAPKGTLPLFASIREAEISLGRPLTQEEGLMIARGQKVEVTVEGDNQ